MTETERIRLDKWLWHARLCKTRALAARLCIEGAVDLDGATVRRPAQTVRVGTKMTLRHHGWKRQVTILGLGTRRGPAPEARALYAEMAPAERIPAADGTWVPLLTLDD